MIILFRHIIYKNIRFFGWDFIDIDLKTGGNI